MQGSEEIALIDTRGADPVIQPRRRLTPKKVRILLVRMLAAAVLLWLYGGTVGGRSRLPWIDRL